MKLKIFSVHDSKAEAFVQPFYSATTGTAVRSFEQAVNTSDHDFHKFAGDYSLFELGSFDQAKGTFEILDSPINLGLAITYIKDSL